MQLRQLLDTADLDPWNALDTAWGDDPWDDLDCGCDSVPGSEAEIRAAELWCGAYEEEEGWDLH